MRPLLLPGNAARILVYHLDRACAVRGVLDLALVAACYAAALGGGGNGRAVLHGDGYAARGHRVLANRTRYRIQARHTAGLGGAR